MHTQRKGNRHGHRDGKGLHDRKWQAEKVIVIELEIDKEIGIEIV